MSHALVAYFRFGRLLLKSTKSIIDPIPDNQEYTNVILKIEKNVCIKLEKLQQNSEWHQTM